MPTVQEASSRLQWAELQICWACKSYLRLSAHCFYCYFYCCQLSVRHCTKSGTNIPHSRSLIHFLDSHHNISTYRFRTLSLIGKTLRLSLQDSQLFLTLSFPFPTHRYCFLLFIRRYSIKNTLLSKSTNKLKCTSSIVLHMFLLSFGSSYSFPILPTRWIQGVQSTRNLRTGSETPCLLSCFCCEGDHQCQRVTCPTFLVAVTNRVSSRTQGLSTV